MTETATALVRHLILCRFKPGTTSEQIGVFVDHFRAMTRKIPGVVSFEFGINNSSEGLNRGLTHACLLTFESARARDVYLPHPEHQAFVESDAGLLAEILVFDYAPEP